jgi:type VI secretion system protein ImpA
LAFIDIDKLLTEISPDEPCGPDLEYDADFVALLQDAEGKPAKYTPDGQLVEDGEDPNWREIKDRCVAMFERTIDLRIAMLLTNAMMCQHGVGGLRDGLALLNALCDRHWDQFHPQLDPDDDNDPLMRMNLVAAFAAPIGADGDPMRFQQRLREVPLAKSRQLGNFALRELMIASGDLPASLGGDSPPNEGLVDGAFKDTDGDELKQAGEAAAEAVTLSRELDQWLTNKVGASNAADLGPWHSIVGDLHKRLSQRVVARFPAEAVMMAEAEAGGDADAAGTGGGGTAPSGGPSLSGGVHSRDDVLRALEKVLEYYSVYEPSSPVPMLLRRAQRLVTMDFMDIIRELSPNAIEQLRVIGGDEAMQASAGPVSTAPVPMPTSEPAAPPPPPPQASPSAGAAEPVKLSASDFAPRS